MPATDATTCTVCDEPVAGVVVFCLKCGRPHHRRCFETAAACGAATCRCREFVDNDTGEVVSVPPPPPDERVASDRRNDGGDESLVVPAALLLALLAVLAFAALFGWLRLPAPPLP